jgi:glutamate synthase (NADPH/NADH) large chain
LGPVGDNFGAGMTGGMAFVYDTDGTFEQHVNREHVTIQRIQSAYWDDVCRRLVEEHIAETGSAFADDLLIHWDLEIGNFWQVVPSEVVAKLEQPLIDGDAESAAAGAD